MHYTVYFRLVALTAGTLLPFFWMIVILGHRRQRDFERIFFFLCLALVFFFGSSLLALNAQLYYTTIPAPLAMFTWTVLCLGLWFLPSLLVHLHIEYAQIRELLHGGNQKRMWLIGAYAPAVLLLPLLYGALRRSGFDFLLPSNSLGLRFQIWLLASLFVSAGWQWRFLKAAPDDQQKSFHWTLLFDLALVALWLTALHVIVHLRGVGSEESVTSYSVIVTLFAVGPLIGLIRNVQRSNFLQIGRQRNLIYAVFATFLALLYLGFIRRASQWMEPYLPPEATAAILLFLPVVFFEPLQRLMKKALRRTAQTELDRAQRLMGPILEVARLGNLEKLSNFIKKWIGEEVQLAEVKLALSGTEDAGLSHRSNEEVFVIRQGGQQIGTLTVKSHGAMVSGETVGALEFLCEQLPGALDLCRLIEEKLQLERELAERERLALVGQMAASISHNLKNPLGSMKTILQVQLENPELPDSIRGETKMVLDEISRLSTKLNQLLQFSRPAVRGRNGTGSCDATAVIEEVAGVLSHEAERRGLELQTKPSGVNARAAISPEALNDIVSNLVVNALEATPRGGHVSASVASESGDLCVLVEDDGPGVPAALREKILQPFFTTKSQGTGLGLAIVARRVAEFGGKIDWESPVKDGKGTRFKVTLPMER
ncbi:MAG TPA: ATP-binding protein [Candidatus Acidoferrum sp.]|nr:ATP-binding protein [Candidatus Acidoferrum sp.]